MSRKILFVDDDPDVRHIGVEITRRAGYNPVECESGQEALRLMQNDEFDLIVSDMRMPNMNGIELLKLVKLKYPDIQFILVTGYASIQNAIQATREGADDYVSKPFSPSQLLHVIDAVISKRELINENRLLQNGLSKRYQIGNIIGASRPMQNVYGLIEKAARSQANVVIHGETGTGKELVARSIHFSSPQSKAPFLGINCGAIPENLLESELFGHVRGSFTGAIKDKPGLFESAGDGTIFLDEIGEMPQPMQVKLLRVLDDRCFRRVGDNSELKMKARIITATHRNLDRMVSDGVFREDLFYRLQVIPIIIPPLRMRKGDIALLIEHFTKKHTTEDSNANALSDQAMAYLINYSWPGNVRELENLIQRLIALEDSTIITHLALPAQYREQTVEFFSGVDTSRPLSDVESEYIEQVLKASSNLSQAAKTLGIARPTLYAKIKQYNIKA